MRRHRRDDAARLRTEMRYLVARLERAESSVPHVLGVVSALEGEGVSTVVDGISRVLSQERRRTTCVLELAWRDDTTGPDELGSEDGWRPGVADVLRGRASIDDALQRDAGELACRIPSGAASVTERTTLATSSGLDVVVDELAGRFDHVLLDLPAVHVASESIDLARMAGGLVLVVRQGVTPVDEVVTALDELEGLPVLGTVLNDSRPRTPVVLRRLVGAV